MIPSSDDVYRKFYSEMAAKRDGRILLSRHPENAAILVETIVDDAKDAVSIIDDGSDPSLYSGPGVFQAAVRFLGRNDKARFSILVSSPIASARLLMQNLSNAGFADRIDTDDLEDTMGFSFIVADKRSFRFRRRADSGETEPEIQAFAQFGGDTLFVGSLHNVFAQARDKIANSQDQHLGN